MATLIRATGEQMTVKPASGGKFTLEELQGFVSGFIERIDLENGKAMYVNEDAKAAVKKLHPELKGEFYNKLVKNVAEQLINGGKNGKD